MSQQTWASHFVIYIFQVRTQNYKRGISSTFLCWTIHVAVFRGFGSGQWESCTFQCNHCGGRGVLGLDVRFLGPSCDFRVQQEVPVWERGGRAPSPVWCDMVRRVKTSPEMANTSHGALVTSRDLRAHAHRSGNRKSETTNTGSEYFTCSNIARRSLLIVVPFRLYSETIYGIRRYGPQHTSWKHFRIEIRYMYIVHCIETVVCM